ncbi:MAG: cupin domain-containing protein [Mesorhizobium sp.]
MVQSADIFVRAKEGVWEPTPDGNKRRIVVYTDELMMVEFAFEKGGEGWLHSHPHVQSSYVAEGRFEVTIAGRTETLDAGDSFIVPSGLEHGVKALEKGRLIDCFAPHRADFIKSAK